MSRYVIEVDSPDVETLLLSLLPRLNVRVIEKTLPKELPTHKESFGEVAERLSKTGIAEKFGDPSEWQREIRSWDRVLDGREE